MAKTTTIPRTMSQVNVLFVFARRISSMKRGSELLKVGTRAVPGATKLNTLFNMR